MRLILIVLTCRKYPEVKLQENLDSEIMEVLLQEAKESYDEEIVVELQSVTADEMESNVERIEQWLSQWKENNST
jgi:adenylate kinase